MTKTPDEILGLATQAVKEVMAANVYVRPVFHHPNRYEIYDHLKPRGKQLLASAASHEEMNIRVEEIRAERLVKAAIDTFFKALSEDVRACITSGTPAYMVKVGDDGLSVIPIEHREFFADSLDAFNSAIQEA